MTKKGQKMKSDDHSNDFVPAWKSPWVWGIALIVVTTLIVNFVMITIGLNTHTGLVVDDFYAKGKTYFNAEAKRFDDATRLGWQMKLNTPSLMNVGVQQSIQFLVTDKDGYPVKGADVEFSAFRPNDAKKDFSYGMMEIKDGQYVTEVAFPLPGNWDLIVTARSGDDQMDIAHRVFVEK